MRYLEYVVGIAELLEGLHRAWLPALVCMAYTSRTYAMAVRMRSNLFKRSWPPPTHPGVAIWRGACMPWPHRFPLRCAPLESTTARDALGYEAKSGRHTTGQTYGAGHAHSTHP
jgi:hypothetical protein